MGGNSSRDRDIEQQEERISSYMASSDVKQKLQCGGKYNDRQIKGKLRERYWSSGNSWERGNSFVMASDINSAYRNAPSHLKPHYGTSSYRGSSYQGPSYQGFSYQRSSY